MSLTALKVRLLFLFAFCFPFFVFAQTTAPQNDLAANATGLTSYPSSCSNTTAGTVLNATGVSTTSSNSCGGTPEDDVWYRFVAQGINTTISITNIGSGNGNSSLAKSGVVVEIYHALNGNETALNYTTCAVTSQNGTSLSVSDYALSNGATYYVRVFSKGNTPTANAGFNICVTHTPVPPPPANDDCTNAVTLNIGATNSTGTVWYATGSNVSATCSGTPDDDVWYNFTATSSSASITLPAIGSDLKASGAMLQLFSGSCGAFNTIACGKESVTSFELKTGDTYYVRVYSAGSGSIGTNSSNSGFSITVSGPSAPAQITVGGGRMKEVFQQATLAGGTSVLNDPWEIIYGNDGYLWITEAKGYKVYRMDPNTGMKATVLDISQGSGFLPASEQGFNLQFNFSGQGNPQGGLAGLALHPNFFHPTNPKDYVYLSYIHQYVKTVTNNGGVFFINQLVRFTYNRNLGRLENPVSLCDTLPGSSDHNSQRMIIAPVNGVNYLFYASGDMGAGQFGNSGRVIKAQDVNSYEGKILRFNLEQDGDAGALDKWIPNDNPFNGTVQSAVWSTGIRNNQGFAYVKVNGVDYLFGGSHGPFSDDEINILARSKNYGHPLVIGYTDGNYDGSKAGSPTGTLPLINSETANAASLGAAYQDPVFSAYASPQATVNSIYLNNPPNSGWPSEGWSGMEAYTNSIIPGWKNSLLVGALKGGKMMRFKLNSAGSAFVPIEGSDTLGYFRSVNRFRDVAVSPDGKSIFIVIDKSSTTSGPTSGTPMVSACAGCVLKYTFLGYQHVNNKSTIPASIEIANGNTNACNTATTITIDNTNNNLWVPITGQDGNILAEIKANGNNLGIVSASFYLNDKAVRQDASKRLYLNRNITITPQFQPKTAVSIRLYLTQSELNLLKAANNSVGTPSGVQSISDISIYKNNDACGAALTSTPLVITPILAEAFGTGGYVLQADISSFSSFYFSNPNMDVLPLHLLSFKGGLQHDAALLEWKTTNEYNTSHFELERSVNGLEFHQFGIIKAQGNNSGAFNYSFRDDAVMGLSVPVVYYRLRMVDQDGRFTYSNVISLAVRQRSDIMIFPNPVKSTLSIRVKSEEAAPLSLQITDLQGRTIYMKNMIRSGAGTIEVDVRQWKSQLYIIQILDAKKEVIAIHKFEKI